MDIDAAVAASLQGLSPTTPDPATAARFGMQQAVGTNPDLQAELQRVATQTGVPLSTAAALPEETKRQAAMGSIDFDGLAASAPSTARLLADVNQAKVAHDDIDNLSAIEQAVRSFGSAAVDVGKYAVSAPGAPGGGLLSDVSKAARAVASGAPAASAGLYGLAAAPLELLGLDHLGGFMREQQRSANAVASSVSPPNPNAGLIERGVMSGLQSGGQNLLMMPLGILGGEAAMLGSMGAVTAGQSYGKGRDAGLSPARAVPYAVQDAVAEVVTEKYLGAAGFLKNVQAGASAGKLFMYELAKEVPGEMAATLWQNFNEWANVNPDKPVAQFISEQPAALAETIIATLVGGTTQIGAVKATERALGRVSVDEASAQQSTGASQALANIMQMATASKVRERAADTFEGFMQSATEDGPLEKVYINPAEMQKAGVDLTALAEVAPSAMAQIQPALETGTDVAIPTSELATRLPGNALEQSVLQHLKTDPGGFSQLGAQEYLQTQGESVRAEVEKALGEHQADAAFKDSMRAVEDNVREQLHAANRFTDDVNGPYAAMWASFFGVQAARLGLMPEDLFKKYAPRIVAQTPAGALLDQDVPIGKLGQATRTQQEVVRWQAALSRVDGKDMDYSPKLPTPTVLAAMGLKDKELSLPSRAILKIGQDHPDVPLEVAKNLPALLSDPLYVFAHKDGGLNVVVDAKTASGEPIVVGVREGRVRTITPYNDDGVTGHERLARNLAAAKGKIYARNDEAPAKAGASTSEPDRTEPVEAFPRSGRTLVTRAALVKRYGEGFYQSDEAAVTRGSFDPHTITVALLKAADLSTFLHESGHFFLEVLHGLASQPNAPAALRDDFDTFLRWTGVEGAPAAEGERLTPEDKVARRAAAWAAMTLDEKRAHHEDFARGFEAYLFEGKAPSVELQGMFQRFRAWLLNVYRSIAALNVNLDDDIRGVFDRMLATTEQIKIAEDARGFEALFKNKPEGMTDDEWTVYQVQANDATQQAITELESRSLRDMKWLANAKGRELKRLQKEAAARRAAIEAEVRKEVEGQPVYQAIAAIRETRKSDPQDREAVKTWQATRDAEQARLAGVVKDEHLATPEGAATAGIKRGQFLARNKRQMANEVEKMMLQWERQNPRPKVSIPDADLNAVAALHGFTSGDELQRAITAAHPIKEVIEGITDQRMLERHAELVDPQSIERAAEEAIHNDARLRFTATETNALRKAVGQPALLAKAVRQFAADIIGRTKVRDLKPSIYTAAEKRAARDAAKAAASGNLQDAAAQKRNQLINGYAAKAALEAQDEAAKVVAYLSGFNRESVYKSLDADYIEQIHNMLERFDLRTGQSLRAIDKRTSLAAWLKTQEEAGLEPDIPPELADEANRTHYRNLTMEQLRGLRDTVKQIEHLGRLKHKLLTAKDQRDYEAIRDSIVQSINDHAGDKLADNRTRPTALDAAIRMFDGYLLEHRKLASLVREMDGFKDGGTLWEYVVRTMNEAGDREATMRAEAADKLAALAKPMLEGGKRGGRGEFFPSTGKSFNREERLGIALNMGNAGNMQRLLDGEGWTLAQVKPVLDTLTAADWQFVQGVWDHLESYRPLVAAKERRVYGKEPNWIEAQPLKVETADGKTLSLRGGYYPIKYDTAQSGRAEALSDAEAAKQQMRGAFTSATTRRSFTKARSEEVKGRPLLYSTDALFGGVNEIIHDLSWHEWLIDANRLLRSKSIDNAIRSRYGAEVARQLKSAVKDIAAGEFPATHAFERVTTQLRAGTMIAGLGLNIMNSVINVQGLTQSMVRIGTKWTAVGIGKFAQNPMALSREVAAKSELMANRAKTLNREVNEIQSLVRDKSKAREVAERIMFMPLTMTQQVVDLPTWWGAYQKALDGGEQDARAVSLADQAVLDAQSGGQVKDLAGIQRGGPLLKLWTTFYGFFNSTYNLTVESTKATDFKDPLQVVKLAGDYLLLWTLPALLGTLLKNAMTGGDWDPDKLAKKAIGDQISYLLGMLVGVRELSTAAQAATGTSDFGSSYAGPAGARFVGELTKLAVQAHQGDVDAAFLKSLDNVGGMLFKYPSGQINRTAEGIAALHNGDTSNPLAIFAGAPPKK